MLGRKLAALAKEPGAGGKVHNSVLRDTFDRFESLFVIFCTFWFLIQALKQLLHAPANVAARCIATLVDCSSDGVVCRCCLTMVMVTAVDDAMEAAAAAAATAAADIVLVTASRAASAVKPGSTALA